MGTSDSIRFTWEFAAWYLIDPRITERDRSFTRAEIMREITREDFKDLYNLMILSGKKTAPQQMENTLQRTVENMRDKGWIMFLNNYHGDYRLTDKGYRQLLIHKGNIGKVRGLTPEERKVLRELAKNNETK